MLVRFIKRWRNYNGDEVAEFDDAMAQDIIASGFAVVPGQEAESEGESVDGLPQQGGDGADTLQGGDGAGNQSQIEPDLRGRRGKAEHLPPQGAAETVAGGDGADTVTGGQPST